MGFGRVMGTRTAMLEANLDQQLAGLAHEPLFWGFIDMMKAYALLYRERLLRNYW